MSWPDAMPALRETAKYFVTRSRVINSRLDVTQRHWRQRVIEGPNGSWMEQWSYQRSMPSFPGNEWHSHPDSLPAWAKNGWALDSWLGISLPNWHHYPSVIQTSLDKTMITNEVVGRHHEESLTSIATAHLPPEKAESSLTQKNGPDAIIGSSAGDSGVSHRRLVIIVIGLCLTIFLTALDQVHPLNLTFVNVRQLYLRQSRQ